jgi:hypothetical protein
MQVTAIQPWYAPTVRIRQTLGLLVLTVILIMEIGVILLLV